MQTMPTAPGESSPTAWVEETLARAENRRPAVLLLAEIDGLPDIRFAMDPEVGVEVTDVVTRRVRAGVGPEATVHLAMPRIGRLGVVLSDRDLDAARALAVELEAAVSAKPAVMFDSPRPFSPEQLSVHAQRCSFYGPLPSGAYLLSSIHCRLLGRQPVSHHMSMGGVVASTTVVAVQVSGSPLAELTERAESLLAERRRTWLRDAFELPPTAGVEG